MADAPAHGRHRVPNLLVRIGGVGLLAALLFTHPVISVYAQRVEQPADTTATAPSKADSLKQALRDSVLARMSDTTSTDTASSVPTLRYSLRPPHSWMSEKRAPYDRLLDGDGELIPPIRDLAAGDLADWLALHGRYDIDDAPGVGQTRYYTRWGLVNRTGGWYVDGRPVIYQRLSFPQSAAFDPGILPSFSYSDYHIGDRVRLDRDTAWSTTARSTYLYRQGDFADTYSEGMFRRLLGQRLGVDLGAAFFDSDGRFTNDNRDLRYLRLQTFTRLYRHWHGSYHWYQFRDQTAVLTPDPYTLVGPRRDDLFWIMDFDLYRPDDSVAGARFGLRIQSGKQVLRTSSSGYRLNVRDQRWVVSHESTLRGWHLNTELIAERLNIDDAISDRWGAQVELGRTLSVGDWMLAVQGRLSDWDTDPLAVGGTVVLEPGSGRSVLLPTVHVRRHREVPTLFDRRRARVTFFDGVTFVPGLYAEEGDAALAPQWHHALTLTWRSDGDPDSMGSAWFIQGHAEHVADYMRWQQQTRAAETDSSGVPLSEDTVLVRPESDDVKSVGATVGALARLGAGFMIWSNYTLKYAVDADENKLAGYYPHKAAAVLSYVRPHVTWGIGLRANIAAVYWYSDRRIAPTIYTEPHVFRVDLSGTATLNSFQFNILVQNLFNFAYRTRAEYPLTGRTLRVGFEWHFLD